MTPSLNKPELVRIPLKYKSLEAFAKAARLTFHKGRMTVKTKKDLKEGQRILLSISMTDRQVPVEIVAEVIQKVEPGPTEESKTYGVRWLNFTEKKLLSLEAEAGGASPQEMTVSPSAKLKSPPPAPAEPPSPPRAPAVESAAPSSPPPPPPTVKAPSSPPAAQKTVAPPKTVKKKKEVKPGTGPSPSSSTPASEQPIPFDLFPPPSAETESQTQVADSAEESSVSSVSSPVQVGYTRLRDQYDLDALLAEVEAEERAAAERKKTAPREAEEEKPLPAEEGTMTGPEVDTSLDVQLAPAENEEPSLPAETKETSLPAADFLSPLGADLPPPPEPPRPGAFPLPADSAAKPPLLGTPEAERVEDVPADEKVDLFEAGEEPVPLGDADWGTEAGGSGPHFVAEELPPLPPESVPEEVSRPLTGEEERPSLKEEDLSAAEAAGERSGAEEIELPPLGLTKAEPVPEEILSLDEIPESPEPGDLAPALSEEEDDLPGAPAPAKAEAERTVPAPAMVAEEEAVQPLSDEALQALGIFLQKLLKLMMQPDKALLAPGSRELDQLYEEFKTVMKDRSEIVIYLRSAGAVKEYMLAGSRTPAVNLKSALPPDQFDALAVKLAAFFSAKGLVGIQFERYLTADAFRQFVVRMGRYDPGRESPEELAAGLLRDGVFHVSPVHAVDRVKGAEELDFRVDLALARLRGDLKRIQVAAEAMGEEPEALWTLRVEDALKILPDGRLRAAVMIRAAEITGGQDLLSASDLVQEIVLATPAEKAEEAAEFLARRYEELFSRQEKGEAGARLEEELEAVKRALRQVTARLLGEKSEAAARIMSELYRKEVFTLEELPPQLRERAMFDQFIDLFIQAPEKRLTDFSALTHPRNYRLAALRYGRMILELVRRGRMDLADLIFRTLLGHIKAPEQPFPERPEAAREAFNVLSLAENIALLINALKTADKENRDQLAALIYAAGPAAAEPLIELLATDEDRSLRRLVCQILTRLGEKVSSLLTDHIRRPEAPWYLVRNLIMILGDMKSEILKPDLPTLAAHPHPRVREEMLIYAAKVVGIESEPFFQRALADPELVVRRRAVRILAHFPGLSAEALAGLVLVVEVRPESEPGAEEEQILVEATELLGKHKSGQLPDGRTVEEVIASVLESEQGRGFLGRLTGPKTTRTSRMRAALVSALAGAQSDKARRILAGLVKDKDPLVRQAVQEALQRAGGQ